MPAFEHFNPAGGLPECERASDEVLSLPTHPYLSEAQLMKICDGVLGAIRG